MVETPPQFLYNRTKGLFQEAPHMTGPNRVTEKQLAARPTSPITTPNTPPFCETNPFCSAQNGPKPRSRLGEGLWAGRGWYPEQNVRSPLLFRRERVTRFPARGVRALRGYFRSGHHVRRRTPRKHNSATQRRPQSLQKAFGPGNGSCFRSSRSILARHSVAQRRDRPIVPPRCLREHPQADTIVCNTREDRMTTTAVKPTVGPSGARGETLA